jgi:hypothetical protein
MFNKEYHINTNRIALSILYPDTTPQQNSARLAILNSKIVTLQP